MVLDEFDLALRLCTTKPQINPVKTIFPSISISIWIWISIVHHGWHGQLVKLPVSPAELSHFYFVDNQII
jgi:hypothetical protein